ncbi:MAG: DUF6062 family protein [Oscillospiraceae bacterium]|nr:DUF6062 family protein [Oscillospiraceae bacterium]
MRNNICEIPVEEIFEVAEGCPVCRLKKKLEDRFVDYILGAAMMEPDIRIESNKLGYCGRHLTMMAGRQSRLPLALILETRLAQLGGDIWGHKARPADKKTVYKTARTIETCFICDKIELNMKRFFGTLFSIYCESYEFRLLFSGQEYLCLPHFELLCRESLEARIPGSRKTEFAAECSKLAHGHLVSLQKDIAGFKTLFDYRTDKGSQETQRVRDAIERTAAFLCGE